MRGGCKLPIVLVLALAAPSCKIPFGSAGTKFVASEGGPGPCTRDEHCAPAGLCCSGRCASCCADVDCTPVDECTPGLCREGMCRHGQPFRPVELASAVEMPGAATRIAAMGDVAVLGLARSLAVVDFRVPGSPRFISSQSLEGRLLDLDASPPLVAALVQPARAAHPRIDLVDMGLPRFPRIGVTANLEDLRAVALEGNLLHAVSPAGLHVVDVSSPADPVTLSALELGCAEPVDVAASGREVIVACGAGGYVLVDVADPGKPVVRDGSTQPLVQGVHGVEGRWVLSPGETGPVLVLATTGKKPSLEPVEVEGILDAEGLLVLTDRALVVPSRGEIMPIGEPVRAGDLSDGRAFVVAGEAGSPVVRILEPGDGPSVECVASMPLGPFSRLAGAAFSDRMAALAGLDGGILVVDLRDPQNPRVDHSLVHDAKVDAIAWAGPDEVAVADANGRIVLVDFSVRSAPITRALDLPALDLARAGDALLATGPDGTLSAILHRGLPGPVEAARLDLAGPSRIEDVVPGLVLMVTDAGTQALALDPDGLPAGDVMGPWSDAVPPLATDGRLLIDAAGGLRARTIGTQGPLPGGATLAGLAPQAMTVAQGRLWSWEPEGLRVVSLDPGAGPSLAHATGPVDPAGRVLAMDHVDGAVALVTEAGILVAESTLPPVPVSARDDVGDAPLVAWFHEDGTVLMGGAGRVWAHGEAGVEVDGTVTSLDPWPGGLVASLGASGIAVLGLDGGVVSLVSTLDVKGDARRSASAGDASCVAAAAGGLVVVDLTDAGAPAISGRFASGGDVKHVVALGLDCYALDRGAGIIAVSVVDPATPRLLGALTLDEPLTGQGLWRSGDGLAVAEGRRLVVLGVEEPPAATLLLSFRTDVPATDYVEEAGLAAVVEDGTWLVDLSGEEPGILGGTSTLWIPGSLAIHGDRLLGLGSGALWTLDLGCLRGR